MNQSTQIGLALSFAGALLDFSSGYLILTQSMSTTNEMGVTMVHYNSAAIAWGIGIVVLGVALIATALLSTSIAVGRMRFSGLLMVVYGVIMILVGASMYSNIAPMMEGVVALSTGMFLVGALMMVNGFLMRRTNM